MGNENFLGVRLSSSDFTFVVLEETKGKPKLIESKILNLPKNFSKSETLYWLLLEIKKIITEKNIKGIVIKGSEPMVRRSKSLDSRIELEAMVYLAAKKCGVKNVTKKIKTSIVKDLNLKRDGKKLSIILDTKYAEVFENKNKKIKEATLAVWTILK